MTRTVVTQKYYFYWISLCSRKIPVKLFIYCKNTSTVNFRKEIQECLILNEENNEFAKIVRIKSKSKQFLQQFRNITENRVLRDIPLSVILHRSIYHLSITKISPNYSKFGQNTRIMIFHERGAPGYVGSSLSRLHLVSAKTRQSCRFMASMWRLRLCKTYST